MQRAKTKRAGQDGENLLDQFTSGQLVIGVCAALFLMCLCVLAGMIIERVSSGGGTAANKISDRPAISQEESAAAATQRDRGTSRPFSSTGNSSDIRRASDGSIKPKDTAPKITAAKSTESSRGTGPRTTELTPLPPAEDKTPENPALQLTRDTPPSPVKKDAAQKPTPTSSTKIPPTTQVAAKPGKPVVTEKDVVMKPSPTLPSTQDTSGRATSPTKPPKEDAPPPKTTPKATQEAEPVQRNERGKFGIQVASLQGAKRQTDATAYLSRLKKGGYNAEIFPSEDGRYYRVRIVGYNDRTSAVAACKSLREKAAFYDAWVVKLP